MNLLNHRINTLLFLLLFFAISCAKENIDRPLTVRLEVAPESLNPVTFNRLSTRQIFDLVYQSLFTITLPDGEIKPVLAAELSVLTETDSGYFLSIEIRNDAKWADDLPLTSYDVAFTIKMINLPGGDRIGIKNQTSFIENFEIIDNKNITFKISHKTDEPLLGFDEFYIYPEHLFDEKKVLRNLPLAEIKDHKYPDISESFINKIQTFNFIENKELIIGSNAYQLESWQSGQTLTLTKRKDYWFKIETEIIFEANPEKIVFQIIPNSLSAIIALENGQIDVLSGLSPHEFYNLKTNSKNSSQLSFHEPGSYGLTFFGSNGKKSTFKDKNFRKGMAWLIPYDDIIKVALHGFGERTVGFIPPHQNYYYNKQLAARNFNLDSALNYFSKAGWNIKEGILTNGNQKAEFNLLYKKSIKDHQIAALLLKDSFLKAGIEVNLHPLDGNLLNQRLSESDFDLFIKSLGGGPHAFNYEFILHSDFAPPNGWNFSSFGTNESDSLIQVINLANDAESRHEYLFRFQEIVFDECNVVALYNEKNTIAVNNKFENLHISSLKPGYTLASFKVRNP